MTESENEIFLHKIVEVRNRHDLNAPRARAVPLTLSGSKVFNFSKNGPIGDSASQDV